MLEDILGKVKWLIAVFLSVVALAVGGYFIVANINTTHVKERIVQTCTNASNQVTCIKNFTTGVNSVNQ